MAIYEYDRKPTNTHQATIEIKEIPIYGGSRLGQYRPSYSTINVDGTPTSIKDKSTALGQRVYEFSNHLSNVLVVLADFKVPVTDGTTTSFKTIVVSANDYYPFGMVMGGGTNTNGSDKIGDRAYQNTTFGYRYGFNGKEDDKDFGDKQLIQDYGFRLYNPAIARFLSVDPLSPSYPMLTPYQFASNSPIIAIDLDGLEAININLYTFSLTVGRFTFTGTVGAVLTTDDVKKTVLKPYVTLSGGVSLKKVKSPKKLIIAFEGGADGSIGMSPNGNASTFFGIGLNVGLFGSEYHLPLVYNKYGILDLSTSFNSSGGTAPGFKIIVDALTGAAPSNSLLKWMLSNDKESFSNHSDNLKAMGSLSVTINIDGLIDAETPEQTLESLGVPSTAVPTVLKYLDGAYQFVTTDFGDWWDKLLWTQDGATVQVGAGIAGRGIYSVLEPYFTDYMRTADGTNHATEVRNNYIRYVAELNGLKELDWTGKKGGIDGKNWLITKDQFIGIPVYPKEKTGFWSLDD